MSQEAHSHPFCSLHGLVSTDTTGTELQEPRVTAQVTQGSAPHGTSSFPGGSSATSPCEVVQSCCSQGPSEPQLLTWNPGKAPGAAVTGVGGGDCAEEMAGFTHTLPCRTLQADPRRQGTDWLRTYLLHPPKELHWGDQPTAGLVLQCRPSTGDIRDKP